MNENTAILSIKALNYQLYNKKQEFENQLIKDGYTNIIDLCFSFHRIDKEDNKTNINQLLLFYLTESCRFYWKKLPSDLCALQNQTDRKLLAHFSFRFKLVDKK